jgi:glycosyltransferase involved in cell wall biosynthesis
MNRDMKIIYLHQYFKFPDESGGTRSFDLANGFIRSGYEVEIISATSNPRHKSRKRWIKKTQNGLIIHYIFLPYSNEMNYLKRSLVFLKFLWFSTLKILSLNGDIVIASSTPLTIGIPALIKKWFQKTPFIFEVRDVWPEVVIAIGAIRNKFLQKILYLIEKIIYKNATAIVPLSTDMKKSIISRYPYLTEKQVQVIENISEIDRFQNGYKKTTSLIEKKIGFTPSFTILYAGTFGKVNGLDYVINLAHKLIKFDSRIVFILIGDGAFKQEIKQKAQNIGVLNNNVFIFDSVPKGDLPQLYYECDMGSSFVIAIKELWSNSANKFFDTLAAGRPILINYKGWQKKIINKENVGYVLPSVIEEEHVKDFYNYIHNQKLVKTQGEKAINIAKKYYSKRIALSKYNKLIKDVFIT